MWLSGQQLLSALIGYAVWGPRLSRSYLRARRKERGDETCTWAPWTWPDSLGIKDT